MVFIFLIAGLVCYILAAEQSTVCLVSAGIIIILLLSVGSPFIILAIIGFIIGLMRE